MQRRCECGHYRFRTVDAEYMRCRKCGKTHLKDHAAAKIIARNRDEAIIDGLADLASLAT